MGYIPPEEKTSGGGDDGGKMANDDDIIESAKNGDCSRLRRQIAERIVAVGGGDRSAVNVRCTVDGTTPLYWAACNGHLVVCDWLLRHGADPNGTVEKTGSTALHAAADRGHTKCVLLLLGRLVLWVYACAWDIGLLRMTIYLAPV